MEEELGGIAIIPLITGLIEVAKRSLNMPAAWAPGVALALGLAFSLAWTWALGGGDNMAWFLAVLRGLVWGLSAVGLYSGMRATAETMRGGGG